MMAKSVLIAVPDLLFRSKIRDAATQAGAETSSASTPDAVLEKARRSYPSVVVVDLGDDRLAPFELIAALKSDPEVSSTRVVGFFSHVRIDLRNAAKDAGCDVVLPRSAIISGLAGLLTEDAGVNEPGES